MRLALVCGLAEMFTCAAVRAAAPQDGGEAACLYGQPLSVPPELRAQTLADAHLFGPWDRVADAIGAPPPRALRNLAPEVLLTHSPWGEFERAVLSRFPRARVEVFDNGLVTHLERPVPDEVRGRISRVWLTLAGDLPRPAWMDGREVVEVPPEALRAAARSALERAGPAAPEAGDGRPARLVLGTAFYRIGRFTHGEERDLHRRLVEALWRESDAPILYKEHPRANLAPLLDELDGVIPIRSRLPVELWAEARPIRAAYSLSSTALLTLARVWGVDSRAVAVHIGFDPPLPQVELLRAHLPAWPGTPDA